MLRYGLLGGARPSLPWELFVALGGGALGAGALFALATPLGARTAGLGVIEIVGFVTVGLVLVGIGIRRRRRSSPPR